MLIPALPTVEALAAQMAESLLLQHGTATERARVIACLWERGAPGDPRVIELVRRIAGCREAIAARERIFSLVAASRWVFATCVHELATVFSVANGRLTLGPRRTFSQP